MEKKTKHRLLGFFVVVGLVIILLPLFQHEKEPVAQATLVKAPAFPDQSVQMSSADSNSAAKPASQVIPVIQEDTHDNSVKLQTDDVITANRSNMLANPPVPDITKPDNELTKEPVNANATNTSPTTNTTETNTPNAQLTTAASNNNASTETETTPTAMSDTDTKEEAAKSTPSSDMVNSNKNENTKAQTIDEKIAKVQHSVEHQKPIKTASAKKMVSAKLIRSASARKKTTMINHVRVAKANLSTQSPIDNDGLIRLKNAVWVIQMGSFKNKANALRLVNQLRASGYKAFIQQVAANTRVFVGPESKQTSARALASQLEANLHIHGIVISYKPLAL